MCSCTPQYYLVVLQYTTKLHSGRLNGCVRDLGCGLGKKDFNFRLVSPEENQVLTGACAWVCVCVCVCVHCILTLSLTITCISYPNSPHPH
jgi:hypothetical protein